jgi:diguanylate cyclase (GGDEF)-like protein
MKIQRWAPRIYVPVIAAHVAVLALAPPSVLLWSYILVLATFALTLWLCWRRSVISVAHNRRFWHVLLLAIVAKTAAFLLLAIDAWATTTGTLVAVDPAFFFCMAALLMVMTTTFTPGAPSSRWTMALDAVLALALVWQFYGLLQVQVRPAGQASGTADYLLHMFDGMDLFVAAFASLRLVASRRADERRFFFILTAYAWLDALCAGAHNRFILASESYLPELLLSTPPLVLGILLSIRDKAWLLRYRPPRMVVNAVAGLIPFALSFALCMLALQRMGSSPRMAAGMVMLAIVVYGLRNALLLASHLAIEDERRTLRRSLQLSALRDELTGLNNRRGMQRILERAWERARETGRPLAIAMLDIDRFKDFNDAYGHQAGDDCLSAVGAALRNGTRSIAGAAVGRYGGEEFVVLLEGQAEAEAIRTIEALRRRIDGLQILHAHTANRKVSASAGVAFAPPGRYASLGQLMKAADEALYAAKAAGRDRLQLATG